MRNSPYAGRRGEMIASARNLPNRAVPPAVTIRPATPRLSRRNLLLDVPIFWRLTVGFLLAALIAAVAAGISGTQRAQSLTKEANFYQDLLTANTSLTTADSFLQLMNTESHTLLTDATAASPSRETLTTDQTALQGLTDRYDGIFGGYLRSNLLNQHQDEVALLQEAGHGLQVSQQLTLVASAQRTWQVYREAQAQIAQDVVTGNLADAQALLRAQVEPTNADAQSALRALIQFNGRVASSVRDGALVEEHNQLVASIIAAIVAFLGVLGVGWIISGTLVTRLRLLRNMTQAVEQGELTQRVDVVGRDEIAGVTASVNGMLDTIVGLLDVTRRQRDALTNAAERLFTDVRVAGAGDLRINAAVGNDPIGMLANAFNFTIGRFRRFVLRTQTSVDQLDVLARQQLDRAGAFARAAQSYARSGGGSAPSSHGEGGGLLSRAAVERTASTPDLAAQADQARELVRRVAREGASNYARNTLDYAEQAYLSAGRLSQFTASARDALAQRNAAALDSIFTQQMEELRTLGALLGQVGTSAAAIQRNTTTGIAALDSTLQRIASLGYGGAAGGGVGSTPTLNSTQVYDLLRLSQAFAQDVASFSRQLVAVTQEVRAGVSPFRISPQEEDALLYTPGTGYEEPAGYGAFATESQPAYGQRSGPSGPGETTGYGGGYGPPYPQR